MEGSGGDRGARLTTVFGTGAGRRPCIGIESLGPRFPPSSARRRPVPACGDHRIDHVLDPVRLDAEIGKTGPAQATQLAYCLTARQSVAHPPHDVYDGPPASCERGPDVSPELRARAAGTRRLMVEHDVSGRPRRGVRSGERGDQTARVDLVGNGCCHDSFPLFMACPADCAFDTMVCECMFSFGDGQRMIATCSLKNYLP